VPAAPSWLRWPAPATSRPDPRHQQHRTAQLREIRAGRLAQRLALAGIVCGRLTHQQFAHQRAGDGLGFARPARERGRHHRVRDAGHAHAAGQRRAVAECFATGLGRLVDGTKQNHAADAIRRQLGEMLAQWRAKCLSDLAGERYPERVEQRQQLRRNLAQPTHRGLGTRSRTGQIRSEQPVSRM
jgi:hypothetical protein